MHFWGTADMVVRTSYQQNPAIVATYGVLHIVLKRVRTQTFCNSGVQYQKKFLTRMGMKI